MIIRVLQAIIVPRRSADFHRFVIEEGLPGLRAHDGLIDVYMGLRSEGREEIGVIVSVWRDWDALAEAVGPDPSRPYLLTPETGIVSSVQIMHFEALDTGFDAGGVVEAGGRVSA
jgi:hypothetical protein